METAAYTGFLTDPNPPGWTQTTSGSGTGATRYAESLGGDLGLTIDADTGKVSLDLANPDSDVVTAIDVPTAGAATGMGAWCNSDEYGNGSAATATEAQSSGNGGLQYSWLGGKQRAITDAGLILMGARVYNPVSGSFTSTDPVAGGNSTAYVYPQDPINSTDPTGQAGSAGRASAMYHACRNVAGPKTCVKALYWSRAVDNYTASRVRLPWKQNAIRHFMWQALLTAKYGTRVALRMAAAHEQGNNPHDLDTRVDRMNNPIGRAFGRRHRSAVSQISPLPWADYTLDDLFAAGLRRWRNGTLYTGNGGVVSAHIT